MRRSNFALRLPPTLLAEARKAAELEGVALNQLITLALAEKVSAMRTEEYFEERARRANPAKVNRILARVGKGNLPIEGNELPWKFVAKRLKKKKLDLALDFGAAIRRRKIYSWPSYLRKVARRLPN